MRVALAITLALLAACKQPPQTGPLDAATSAASGTTPKLPTRLEWAAIETQGVFASLLAAHRNREWVWVEAQSPNTLVVHLIPIDSVVDMPALQHEGTFLKGMLKPDADGWMPEIDIRIEPGGSARR